MQSPSRGTSPGLHVLFLTWSPQESATTHSVFESWLWGRTKLFKLTLAKNYFPDMLLPWLCWNKVPLCSGSCGRCVCDTQYPPSMGAPAFFIFQWSSFLQHFCNSSLLTWNYERYWKHCWMSNRDESRVRKFLQLFTTQHFSYLIILKFAISYQC